MKKPLLYAAMLCGCLAASVVKAEYTPGFKFDGGQLTVDPVVNVGVFWESNANNTASNQESGFGWRVQPALSLGYSAKADTIGLNAFYTMERGFDSKDAMDSDSYGASLSWRHTFGQRWTSVFSASYSRSENDEFYGDMWNPNTPGLSRIDKDKSENYNVNGALSYTGNKWQSTLGLGWSRSHELTGFKETTDTYTASLTVGRQIASNTYWNFSLSTSLDDPEYGDKSQSYYLMTGLSGETTAKTSYSAMVGVSMYDYSGYEDDTSFGPSYNISGAYKFSRKITLSAALSSQYEPEYDGNAKSYYVWSHNLNGAMNFQWTDKLNSRLDASLSYEEHVASNYGMSSDYDRTYYQLRASTYYAFNAFVSLYGSVSWSDDIYSGAGRNDDDTDDLRFDLGLSFRF